MTSTWIRAYVAACVIAGVGWFAVTRTAAPRPRPYVPPSSDQAHAFYAEAASREVGARLGALENFPYSEWSQQDEFHAREASLVREYAKNRHMPVRNVLDALDRGMREHWPTPGDVVPQQKIIPCRPRLTY